VGGADVPDDSVKTFDDVFREELAEIRERHNRQVADTIAAGDLAAAIPSTALSLTGLALSGGGIRSASFCLGVMQGLHAKEVIGRIDYLSTVSGGGYIGASTTIGMSAIGMFPFGKGGHDAGETPETRHLRDNSRYLVRDGLRSVVSAVAVYLRGLVVNIVIVLPFLLLVAAFLVSLNPDTSELVTNRLLWFNLTGVFGDSRMPLTLISLLLAFALLIAFGIFASLYQARDLSQRRKGARIPAWTGAIVAAIVIIELHPTLLRFIFEAQEWIEATTGEKRPPRVDVFATLVSAAKFFAKWIAPLVVLALPFLKTLATKAIEGETGTWADLGKRIGSRIVLIAVALIVPLLLWLAMMQLAYWGTAVSSCPGTELLDCKSALVVNGWEHAPTLLQRAFRMPQEGAPLADFHWWDVPLIYAGAALALFALWPFISVNANSLHQLYRDRTSGAFLVHRKDAGSEEVVAADNFLLPSIDPQRAPYHLINAALNVPGSKYANRRGRNADFFVFSKRFIGSEATGYVGTEAAERIVDGLNVGTAMAISGAAAAPNMGMASVRPLSPTIAFLNIRLGRWIRHPRDIAARARKLAGEHQHILLRIPGPQYLLREAFSKSGVGVQRRDIKRKTTGFVFLTDGGHIDNLGVYPLLKRRCRLIIAVDAEADPDHDSSSLVQVERFARIDLGTTIRMNWKPIAERSRAVDEEARHGVPVMQAGPHVAVGLIDYPPVTPQAAERQKGVLIYIKASLSGDENDYVTNYKLSHLDFPNETTADQLFSEEQFEVYRALGEHIARRFVLGEDKCAVFPEDRDALLGIVRELLPGVEPRPSAQNEVAENLQTFR
jgi:hypothetical protein